MSKSSRRQRTTPSRYLPVIMLLVLFGSIVLAWLFVRKPAAGTANAAEIIAEIRNQGLDAYWSPEPVAYWYLHRRNGEPYGWSVTYREGEEGGFRGSYVQMVTMPQGLIQQSNSSWWLNADATRGKYIGETVEASRVRGLQAAATRAEIELRDGKLHVLQWINGQQYESGAKAPANYIPEGLMPLVQALTARKKTEALFRFIQDGTPPSGEYPTFSRLNFHYLGPPDEHPNRAVVEQTFSRAGASSPPATLTLDREGVLLQSRRKGSGVTIDHIRSTPQEVVAAFPDAQATIERLSRRTQQEQQEQTEQNDES